MQRPPFWRVPKNRPDPDDDKPGTWTLHEALAGTPSEGELKPGDVVCKIGEHDARHLTHNDAQTLFRNAGNSINVVVERGGSAPNKSAGPMSPPLPAPVAALPKPPVAGGVATPFAMASAPAAPTYTPLQVNTTPAPPAALTNNVLSPKSPAATNDYSKHSPMQSLPVTVFPPPLPGFTPMSGQPRRPVTPQPFSGMYDETSPEFIDNQPYRTTPLVLPGAKNKREVPITSYLRHHPNPAVRAAPHHFDPQVDVLMKQKVADTVLERVAGPDAVNKKVVHQFNSPIALYSDQNIVESVQAAQSGVTPKHNARVRFATLPTRRSTTAPHSYKGKKTLYYDPAKSETFKALKDSELGDTVTEVPTPIQHKVFTPQKHIQPPLHQMQRNQAPKSPQPTNNFYPLGDEKIHQSYSFRRLMNEVLGESEF